MCVNRKRDDRFSMHNLSLHTSNTNKTTRDRLINRSFEAETDHAPSQTFHIQLQHTEQHAVDGIHVCACMDAHSNMCAAENRVISHTCDTHFYSRYNAKYTHITHHYNQTYARTHASVWVFGKRRRIRGKTDATCVCLILSMSGVCVCVLACVRDAGESTC